MTADEREQRTARWKLLDGRRAAEKMDKDRALQIARMASWERAALGIPPRAPRKGRNISIS